MRIGIIARAEDRGLGILTWEAYRHLPNASALVVDPGRFGQGFPQHPERYADFGGAVDLVHWADNQTFPEAYVRDWLRGQDVVYVAETAYDREFYRWAHEEGAAVVLHTMPELHHADEAAQADAVWCPTPWRMDELPGARLVPVPVALDRFPIRKPENRHPELLHVAGHQAYADRNGSILVAMASGLLDQTMYVACQDPNVPLGDGAERIDPTANYWDLYDGYDVLVLPRRYGGLCLPIQEAMAAGLAVVTLDTPPHDWYGTVRVPAEHWTSFQTGSGTVDVAMCEPRDLAAAVNALTGNRSGLAAEQARSRAWAEAHSWDELLPLWIDELERAPFGADAGLR